MESRRIPLFPLNVVLFPGMPLPLRVFEPRYQEMVRVCRESDRLFGVCLIRSGEEVGGPADPCSVGTTCEILSVTPLGEGRMNLVTVGRKRFKILSLFQERPYLEAEIGFLPDDEPGDLRTLPLQVREAAVRYVNGLFALAGEEPQALTLPDDPEELSHFVGAVLQVAATVRQELLESSVTAARLERELELLEREIEQHAALENVQGNVVRPYRLRTRDISPN
jgi:Lon protease-like protein